MSVTPMNVTPMSVTPARSAAAEAPLLPKRHFAMRRVLLCALPLLVLVLWIVALASLAKAGGTATASSPARISVQIPPLAKNASVVMLELSVTVARKPASGQLGAVVRLRRPGGQMAEVGRMSIVSGEESYQFNVGSMPAGGGSAEVEVALIDRGGGSVPSDAELTIGRVEIVTR
jgi:hypothetical protein